MTDLPAFTTGTEKQIAWAEKIRAAKIEKWSAAIAVLMASSRDMRRQWGADMQAVVNVALTNTDAEAWIDGRDRVHMVLWAFGAGWAGYGQAAAKCGLDQASYDAACAALDAA